MLDDNGVALNSSILSRGTACFSCCSLYPRIYLTVKKNIEFMQCLWIPNKKVSFLKGKSKKFQGQRSTNRTFQFYHEPGDSRYW